MFGDEENNNTSDGLSSLHALGVRVASVEPGIAIRKTGDKLICAGIGEVVFNRMPTGRPSYWTAEVDMPECLKPVLLTLEVENEAVPGLDQVACVITTRRMHVHDAHMSAQTLNISLARLRPARSVCAEDLVLTEIRMRFKPLTLGRWELVYGSEALPGIRMGVKFLRGVPESTWLDSDGDE